MSAAHELADETRARQEWKRKFDKLSAADQVAARLDLELYGKAAIHEDADGNVRVISANALIVLDEEHRRRWGW